MHSITMTITTDLRISGDFEVRNFGFENFAGNL
jgi:hypothetical protein